MLTGVFTFNFIEAMDTLVRSVSGVTAVVTDRPRRSASAGHAIRRPKRLRPTCRSDTSGDPGD